MKETWKAIAGYEGFYEVSNLGNVRSLTRVVKGRNNTTRIIQGRLLVPKIGNGYLRVSLCREDSKIKTISIHRLVASAFLLNANNLPQVNHIDGNKRNNRTDNLEWCTQSENMIHAYKNGLEKPSGNGLEKDVKCTHNGITIYYRGIRTMCRELGISRDVVRARLAGIKGRLLTDYTFEYA